MGTVKITIDDRTVEVEEGINVIEAAKKIGVHIPHFCYHPKLSIVGSCRMCLIEVEGQRKLQPACNTFVREGLVVRTNTQEIKKARQAVLEFLLIHHPLDCPICDKAGECNLQNYTFAYGPRASRFSYPKKLKQVRSLGNKLNLDADRCVLCTRCVRFMREVVKTGELLVEGRGDNAEISVLPGKAVESDYAMMVADLCPVGALTIKPFRFHYRVFMHPHKETVCAFCENLCRVKVGVWRGRVVRTISADTTSEIVCDEGRVMTTALLDTRFSPEPLEMKGDGKVTLQPHEVRDILDEFGKEDAVAVSPWVTIEMAQALREWAERKGISVYVLSGVTGESDEISRKALKAPNTEGLKRVLSGASGQVELDSALKSGKVERLLLVHPGPAARVQKVSSAPAVLVYAGLEEPDIKGEQTYYLPVATYLETGGTFSSAVREVTVDKVLGPLPGVWSPLELSEEDRHVAGGVKA